MSKSSSKKPQSKKKPNPQEIPASRFQRYFVRSGLSACALMLGAMIVFSFAPDGRYAMNTSLGRVAVVHEAAHAQSQMTPPAPVQTMPQQQRSGAAVHISPNAVGAELSNIAIFGFDHALLDEGTGSKVDHFEAHREDPSVSER